MADGLAGRRFYVQYRPDAAGRRYLAELQSDLSATGGRAVTEPQLHLTILHIGIYEQVWAELKSYRPGVSEAVFQTGLAKLLDACERISVAEATIITDKLALYGRHRNTLVLEASADASLRRLHAECLDLLQAMLAKVLATDPLPFMRDSPNFCYALTLRPHITLMKSVTGSAPDVSGLTRHHKLRLERMPLQYDEANKAIM